ncbi:phosphoribosyltransferase [Methanococcus vannielii SB]|jgi:orotate phosphoribosyltransferase|uniref:Transcriptional regulator GfcR n=1 Tax=Methanococcus vannielii (strain ATCC 35089 / DSM 1224 / JCM 13029 / OCM 148 / SB) TaxID=406327 RepID=GFCR_METVS|nr:orotate phosphoribosyltransferase-like protein [Methanococcus vannielii]A6UR69.1 RecName: Full=PyrE-like protein [Methanococcus vannielii SB]ABR54991.1 phosphoribosyltransferase [Methanococcus vannielii SB]
MKKELIYKALKLRDMGFPSGDIAEELNISVKTALYLTLNGEDLLKSTESPKEDSEKADIFLEWDSVRASSKRLKHIAKIMCDILGQVEFDGIVGISSGGVPLATLISDEMDKNFSIFVPKKHIHTEKEKTTGFIGQNFSSIVGKDVIIVDDVMTSGNAVKEAIKYLKSISNPKMVVVVMDKSGIDEIDGVPVHHLFRTGIVDIKK